MHIKVNICKIYANSFDQVKNPLLANYAGMRKQQAEIANEFIVKYD
jgi:hypothetical protein